MVNVSDELIEKMARRIVHEVDPERIVLFGSWARGEARKWSDVDLLVVERESFGPHRSRRQEAARIWRCLSEFRVPTAVPRAYGGHSARYLPGVLCVIPSVCSDAVRRSP